MMKIVVDFEASVRKHPLIHPGTLAPYKPPEAKR
jgi:hypothetical protein